MTPVIWLLGVSGSGKTTLGSLLRLYLESRDLDVTFVDSDRLLPRQRGRRRSDLFRELNDLREYVLELHEQNRVCVVSAVTPYEEMRHLNREFIPLYKEVWLRCSLTTAALRDPRGLYRAAVEEKKLPAGFAEDFDEPVCSDLILDTDHHDLSDSYVALRDFAMGAVNEAESWSSYLSELGRPLFAPAVSGLSV